MKRFKFVLALALLCMCSSSIQAQSVKDIIEGVVNTVVGDKATNAKSIKGTWKYSQPACEFESESFLSKAGGAAVTNKIKKRVAPVMKSLGINGIVSTFDGEGNYTTKIKKQTIHGTYTFNSKEKTITFKPKFGKEYTAHVSVQGKEMTLVFNADKLMTILKSISNTTATQSTTAATINALLKSYNGMRLGFKLKK